MKNNTFFISILDFLDYAKNPVHTTIHLKSALGIKLSVFFLKSEIDVLL